MSNVVPLREAKHCDVCDGTGWRHYEWEAQPQPCPLCNPRGYRRHQARREHLRVVGEGIDDWATALEPAALFEFKLYGGG